MTSRIKPKRSTSRSDYRKLAELIIPSKKAQWKTTGAKHNASDKSRHFRLKIVDEDVDNELMKVHYVVCDSRFNE